MADDPELRRVAELLAAERSGSLDDAEEVELSLYRDEHPSLVAHAQARLGALVLPSSTPPGADDRAWLARHQQDESLARAHHTPWTRAERGTGLALIAGGWLAAIGGFMVGPFAVLAGIVLLLFSFVRVRLTRSDPYDQIER